MRRVSKAKAASMEAVEAEAKKPFKKKRVVDEDAVEENDEPATAPLPRNGKSAAADEGEDSEAESFEVESILSSRVRHGTQQFKIRWKGYGPADDTWEDEENVDSPELIAAFLRLPDKDPKASKSPAKKVVPKKGTKRSSEVKPKTKAAKKAKPEKGDEDVEYEVSKIIDYVDLKDGTRQFLVRWKGFSAKENTWEPEANLNCPELIQKYLAAEEKKEDMSRETREVRQQVNKYNPELTKRRSHRSSTKKRISYHDLE